MSDRFHSNLWKEILTFAFQDVMFFLVGEHNLFHIAWNFHKSLLSIFLIKNASFLIFFTIINVEYFDNFSSSVLFTCNCAIEIITSDPLYLFWIDNCVENFFIVFFNDVLWNFITLIFFGKMPEDDLNFSYNGNVFFLIVENYSLGLVELRIINFELIKIVAVFNIQNTLLDIFWIINLNCLAFSDVESKKISSFWKFYETFLDSFQLNFFRCFKDPCF